MLDKHACIVMIILSRQDRSSFLTFRALLHARESVIKVIICDNCLKQIKVKMLRNGAVKH